MKSYLTRTNLWIVVILLLANGLAWFSTRLRIDLIEAVPILHPEIAEIRQHWQARDAVGETFQVVVTDQMAMETLAWFIARRDNLPFSHPQIHIHPDGVEGGGLVHVLGLRTPVMGRANVWLENGRLEGEVLSIGIAGTDAPEFVITALSQAQKVYADLQLPIEITRLEMTEGQALIEGVYR